MLTVMLRGILFALAAVALFAAPSATAAPCNAKGDPGAKSVPYASDSTTAQALAIVLDLSFHRDVTLFFKPFKPDNADCREASFGIGSLHYVLLADDTKIWPRVAENNDGDRIYLIGTLRPESFAKARRALSVSMGAGGLAFIRPKPADMLYVLATDKGSSHSWTIYGFYDAVPETPRLAQVMCQAVLGSLPVAATYDTQTHMLTVKDAAALMTLGDVGKSGGPCTVGPPA